ncbi:MAG: hypothetical protein ACTHOH_15970 [Lysobacteraceae bacterium]
MTPDTHPDGMSSLLALGFVALLSLTVALLFFAYAIGTIAAIGAARERGPEWRAVVLAVAAFLLPPIGWGYLFIRDSPAHWVRRHFWIGLASLAGAAVLSLIMLQWGVVAS